jgi:hypothetical protein
VTELETTASRRSKRKMTRAFVRLNLDEAAAGLKALGATAVLVWYALLYRAWAEKRDTVAVPTTLLGSWGLDRSARWRALTRLARAGLVRLEPQGAGKTSKATLLRPPPPA